MTSPTPTAETTAAPSELHHGLKVRHLTMMGLGSAIGAGLFLGTGVGIQAAGPAVLVSYAVAGIIVVFVMNALGEMGSALPSSGAFSTYAELAFGRHAGFVTGWLYWFMLIMVLGAEITGASGIMSTWFGVDPWIPALVCMVFFTVINLAQVRNFGEFEFWFALIKVAVLVAFLVIGVLLIFGLLPGTTAVGTTHFLGEGFMPEGIAGIAAGLLAVAFAFGGIEIVTIAAAEADDPSKSITLAVRSVIFRILVFYLGAVLVITFLLPRTAIVADADAATSPFSKVLELATIPGVVGVMEAVVVLALLSAFNAQIYASSRMAWSLSSRGEGPSILARTSPNGVPLPALLVSMFFGFVAVALNFFNIAGLLAFLLNAVGASLLVIWSVMVAAQLRLRPRFEERSMLSLRAPGAPATSIAALVLLALLTLLMLTDANARDQIIATTAIVLLLTAFSVMNSRVHPKTEKLTIEQVQAG